MRFAIRRLRYRAWRFIVEYGAQRFRVVANSLPMGERPLRPGQ
jgi:hypothetical protein